MTLPDLKQLDRLIALCRKRGVKVVKMGELELTLSEDAPAKATRARRGETIQADTGGEPEAFDALTEEEKLFWSTSSGVSSEPEGNGS